VNASNQKPANGQSAANEMLDLLLDALVERQEARKAEGREKVVPTTQPAAPVPAPRPDPPAAEERRPAPKPARPPAPKVEEPQPQPPPRQPSIQMGKMIGRLALLVVALLVLVNIPVTRYGVSLARILPETSSLIIRDGLVLKGSSSEIYILESDKLRWISSMDAFEHRNLTWQDVHVVEDEFLAKFEKGPPIHVLLKCRTSPHIYRLENDKKRWIQDIETFEAEGHVWQDVRMVSCQYLLDLPDGVPIPEDAGPPPQP
jgi:hypothetical protein